MTAFNRVLRRRFCTSCVIRIPSKNLLELVGKGKFNKIFPEPSAELCKQLTTNTHAAYAGFDATGGSLHAGHLLPLIGLIHIQRAGHQPVAVIGTGTALIGDPSGKSTERDPLSFETVAANATSLEENIRRVFDNHERLFWPRNCNRKLLPVKILRNGDWLTKWGLLEFLSTVGRKFRVGQMLAKESVKSRLATDEGMSLAEFCYQAFQSYDWYYLLSKHSCMFQIGGSDQHGNMYAGYELIRRLTGDTVYSLTVPLMTTELGGKFGKTAGTAMWLDAEKTPAFDIYQYFIRVPDADVEQRLRLLTFMNDDEMQQVLAAHASKPESRMAQRTLAEHVTRLVHGDEGLKLAQDCSGMLFNTVSNAAELLAGMQPKQIAHYFGGAGSFREILMQPGTTVKQMAMRVKCFPSERDAERIIRAGGFYVNHRKVQNPDAVLVIGEHVLPNNISLLRVGKQNNYIVHWTNM